MKPLRVQLSARYGHVLLKVLDDALSVSDYLSEDERDAAAHTRERIRVEMLKHGMRDVPAHA